MAIQSATRHVVSPYLALEWGQCDDVLDVLEDEPLGGGVVGGEAGAVVVEVRDQVLPEHGHAGEVDRVWFI